MFGGFQSFVAWRYLMERRPPMHRGMVAMFAGIAAFGALGFGLAEGMALADGLHAGAGLPYLAACALGLLAVYRRGVPWIAFPLFALAGLALGLLDPGGWDLGRIDLPKVVLWSGAALVVFALALYAILGSRPIGSLVIGFFVSASAFMFVGYGLEWYWRHHEKGKPFNNLVKGMSLLHAYDDAGAKLLLAIGGGFTVIGMLLRIVKPKPRSVRSMIAYGFMIAAAVTSGFGGVVLQISADQTVAEWARFVGLLALAPLVLLIPLGVFRYFFTFFTTVSMAGVFVGSMALVVVLSVMSGFEADLRVKILGSNAHIRVTMQDGMMSDWKDVMARVKAIRGVKGVTPYATTEVVLSANQNYATVVIKGIDPATVGDVNELFKDILGKPKEQLAAVKDLEPEIEDPLDNGPGPDDAGVPADAGAPGDVIDQAPPDLAGGGEPIDFSGGDDDDDEGDDDSADTPPPPQPPPPVKKPASKQPSKPIQLKDMIEGVPGGHDDLDEPPPDTGRLALLHGVLVGQELEKQLHLFAGQEVRLVSPLADPANPDATGTPIPFHRDYRIAGIFYTGMYEYDLKFVYVTLESLQDFIQLGDDVDGVEVRIGDPDETGGVVRAIQKELGPDYKVQDWKELNRNLFSALKLEKIAMFLVLAIIILVASFSIVGNLIMVVVEKGKEIALLKTLGASDLGVMLVFVMQGFFIGLVGTVAGVVEGLVICLLCKVFGFPINPDVYYIRTLPIHVEWYSVTAIAAAGLAISAMATWYPAYMAARLRPAEGLRHD